MAGCMASALNSYLHFLSRFQRDQVIFFGKTGPLLVKSQMYSIRLCITDVGMASVRKNEWIKPQC